MYTSTSPVIEWLEINISIHSTRIRYHTVHYL